MSVIFIEDDNCSGDFLPILPGRDEDDYNYNTFIQMNTDTDRDPPCSEHNLNVAE